jgi:hypothetical protein
MNIYLYHTQLQNLYSCIVISVLPRTTLWLLESFIVNATFVLLLLATGLHFIAWVRTPVQDTVEKEYPHTLCRYCTLIVLIPSPTPLQAQYSALIPHSKWYILVTGIPTLAMKCNPVSIRVRIVRATDRWLPPEIKGCFALSFRGLQ